MVTYQNNNELNIGNKLMKLDKIDNNSASNIGPLKTEVNSGANERKVLPKIKGNNTLNNFMKNSTNNIGNANRTLTGNNVTQDNEGEDMDINDGIDEKEEEKPKITKIVKVNKD